MKALKRGFTLIEVLIAALLLGLVVFATVPTTSSSLYNSADAENLAVAVQLLQKKASEMEFYFQKKLDSNGVSGASEKREGSFEEPFQDYKWRAEFRETKLEIKKEDLLSLLTSTGMESGEAEVQIDQQTLAIGNVNRAIKTNFGELEVWVEWNRLGRTKKMNILTHLIPAKPKVTVSANAEVE